MSISMDLFCFDVPLTMMFDSVFSVSTSVGGCGWTVSAWDVLMDVTFWQFSNIPLNYASVADTMKFIIMLNSTCTGTFYGRISCICVLNFGPRKKYPHDLIRTSGSDMWDASQYMWRIILLILYCVTASRCVAL